MNKKVLILSGSPRKGGNSDLLCGEFARGAREGGNEVEIIRVAAKKIAPCSGCYYCRAYNGECAHKDDMAEVLQKMIDADVIVMASPVYFYSIDAQLKAVIDRTVARWLEVKNKDFYYNYHHGGRGRFLRRHHAGLSAQLCRLCARRAGEGRAYRQRRVRAGQGEGHALHAAGVPDGQKCIKERWI